MTTSELPHGNESIWVNNWNACPLNSVAIVARAVYQNRCRKREKICWQKFSGCVRRMDTWKTCKPWFWKTNDASSESTGSLGTKTKNTLSALFSHLLSDAKGGQMRIYKGRNHGNLTRKWRKIRLSLHHSGALRPQFAPESQGCPVAYEEIRANLPCQNGEIPLVQGRRG